MALPSVARTNRGIPRECFDQLIAAIHERMPGHVKFLKHTLGMLEDAEIAQAEGYISYLLERHGLTLVVDAYQTIVDDTVEAQLDFMRSKRYRHSTFAEVAASVYFDAGYMRRYMVGLALSSFLWANHVEIRRFFQRTLPLGKGGRYLEIGPGHGCFLVEAMRRSAYETFTGVDISPSSIALTDDVVRSLAPERRHNLALLEMDFLAGDGLEPPFDAIVMGEVLEHVERPDAFLRRIAELARPGAYIFVTTCVNAPAVDHIYQFRTVRAVEDLVSGCDFAISERAVVPHPGQTLERCTAEDLPIDVAYVLAR